MYAYKGLNQSGSKPNGTNRHKRKIKTDVLINYFIYFFEIPTFQICECKILQQEHGPQRGRYHY